MLLTLVLLTAAVAPSLLLSLALGGADRPWLPSPNLRSAPPCGRPVVRGPRSPGSPRPRRRVRPRSTSCAGSSDLPWVL